MPPLFPPWTDHLVRPVIVLAVAVVLGVPLLLMAWVRTPYATGEDIPFDQPVQFDHRHHVRDDGISCLYCHTTADRQASAGIPPTELCLNCHNQIWNDSPLLSLVWRSYVEQEPIRWVRVTNLPDFVYFDHGVHTTSGVACETCHGRVDLMARVYQARALTMGWCLECHRDPEAYIQREPAVLAAGWPRPIVRRTAAAAEPYDVRALTQCTACHR